MGTVTEDLFIPTYEQLTVPELRLTYPILKCAAQFLGKYCDNQSKEFILCRDEEKDVRKCLIEGQSVTNCGIEFFQKVKTNCRPEFEAFVKCVDHKSYDLPLHKCRELQRPFDACMSDKLGISRPELGYFTRPRVHQSERPKPIFANERDYEAEARAIKQKLPDDYPLKEEPRRYVEQPFMFPNL